MKQETIDGNRLIAEFMGWQSNKYPHLPKKVHQVLDGQEIGVRVENLEYHSSWDWLMPVVKRINETAPHFTKESKSIVENIYREVNAVEIQLAFSWVLEYIQWYNTQNSNA